MIFNNDDFFEQAAAENRIVHLAIDNQVYFSTHQKPFVNHQSFLQLCEQQAEVTKELAVSIPTVHVAYHLPQRYLCAAKMHWDVMENYLQKVSYCPQSLRATQKAWEEVDAHVITADLINTEFTKQNVFFKKSNSAFSDGRLNDFLSENGYDVLVFSGLYLDACIRESLLDASNYVHPETKQKKYTPLLLEDCILNPNNDKNYTPKEMAMTNLCQTRLFAKNMNIDTMSSDQFRQQIVPAARIGRKIL